MNNALILIASISLFGEVAAQNFQMYVVRAGKNPSWSIPDTAEYKFTQFEDGYIEMTGNKRTQDMKMNFNHLYASPVMLKSPGDTVMVGTDIVKAVWIGKTCFLYSEDKYYEMLSFAEPVKLVKQHYLRLFRTELVDSYGNVSNARTSQTIRGRRPPGSPNMINEISVNTQQSFKFQTDYYFIGPGGKAEAAKKSVLLKRIKSKDKKDKVEKFIEDNDTDFRKEEDLMKLVEYCQSL